MNIYKYFPVASDRMGIIWTLSSIEDVCIIEFGPAGTTHYAVESIGQLNGKDLSNIYSTHIDESDITFGNYERLEKSILEVDLNKKPKYIFVMASSVSSVIGVDIKSVCREIQSEINAKLIPITTGGLKDDYNIGVEEALTLIAENIVKTPEISTNKFNIIGCNIDSYNFLSDCNEVKRMMKDLFNKDLNTIFTSYTSIDSLEKAAEANLNIVVRKEGIKAAEYMKEKYNIPYIYGKPIGLEETLKWLNTIKSLMEYDINKVVLDDEVKYIKDCLFRLKLKLRSINNKNVAILGDYDTVLSMKRFVENIGLRVDRAEILHNCECNDDEIIINSGERNRFNYLKDTELLILMSDAVSIDMNHKSKLDIQISNPNLDSVNIYPYTPYLGLRGVLVLIEKFLGI